MTAEEKAIDLFNKYITSQHKWYLENLVDGLRISQAKQCAKIAVEEIILTNPKIKTKNEKNNCVWYSDEINTEYWNKVLNEIENL